MTKLPLDLEIEEIEKQLTGDSEINDNTEQEATEEVPDAADEEVAVDDAKEPVKEVVEQKSEPEKVDNSIIARMRWEAAEERRKREALEAEIEALKAPKKEIPAKEESWEGHTEARIETAEERLERLEREVAQEREMKKRSELIETAKSEFTQYEEQFKAEAPDYEEARAHVVKTIALQHKMRNPNIAMNQLAMAVQNELLVIGSNAVNMGINPAKVIYEGAKNMGYSKAMEQAAQKQSNLSKIAGNRGKSAGMAASSGASKANATVEQFAKMTNAEISRMSDAEIEAYEKQLLSS